MEKIIQNLKDRISRIITSIGNNDKLYINNLYDTFFITTAFIIFGTLLVYDLHNSRTGYFTLKGLQFAFAAVVSFTSLYLLFLLLKNRLDLQTVVMAILVTGTALRFCYMFFTGPGTRTHDVYRDQWGHMDYIKYIADHYALPPVNICQAYHPPVHHIISAIVLDIARGIFKSEFLQLKLIQVLMATLNSLTLILFYKIIKRLDLGTAVTLTGVSIFAFHPTNVYFASKLNNDNTMMFFYVLAFYYLIKWLQEKSAKDVVLLALFTSLAILTKKSAVMLLIPIAAAFLVEFVKHISSCKLYIKQFTTFSLIALPLSVAHQLRNYILFNQDLGYVPSMGRGFDPTIYNLLYLPVGNIISSPFNNGGLKGGEFFPEFLFKSSLFGEWKYPGLEIPALLLVMAAAAVLIVLAVYLLTMKKEDLGSYGYIFLLNLIVPILIEVKFRTDFPVACSQDFRYVAPILVSIGYFLGKAYKKASDSKHRALKPAVIFPITAFCLLSSIFVTSLGRFD